jgi:hypothetical protein
MNFRAFSKIISMVLLRVKLHNLLNVDCTSGAETAHHSGAPVFTPGF